MSTGIVPPVSEVFACDALRRAAAAAQAGAAEPAGWACGGGVSRAGPAVPASTRALIALYPAGEPSEPPARWLVGLTVHVVEGEVSAALNPAAITPWRPATERHLPRRRNRPASSRTKKTWPWTAQKRSGSSAT